MSLKWNDLTFAVEKRSGIQWSNLLTSFEKNEKILLNELSGELKAGEMVALLGPSGAGKTSLLNALSGRVALRKGQILINNSELSKKYRHLCGYVEQKEFLFEHLTVYETLFTVAMLRLERNKSYYDKMDQLENVLQLLGLKANEMTQVQFLSGGERKRLTIAMELIHSPSFLFLDEPTSGLDSFTALSLITTLSEIAKSKRKIIFMTLHQPRQLILQRLDKFLLMTQGRFIFFGTLEESLLYFSKIGFNCPQFTNSLDFYLDLITLDTRSLVKEKESQQRIHFMIQKWSEQELHIEQESNPEPDPIDDVNFWKNRPNFFHQFYYLLKRNILDYKSYRAALIALFLQTILLSVMVSGLFWQMGFQQEDIQNRMGLLFFIVVQEMFAYTMPISVRLPEEKKMMKRERWRVMYKSSAWYLSKIVSVLPQALVGSWLFTFLIYWSVQLVPYWQNFLIFLATITSLVICSQALGMIVGALSPNLHVSLIFGPLLNLVLVAFAGNLLNPEKIPFYLKWVQYISPAFYAYRSFMQNEMQNLQFQCPPNPNLPCFQTGEKVLNFYHLNEMPIWLCLLSLWILFFGFHVIGYILIRILTRPKE